MGAGGLKQNADSAGEVGRGVSPKSWEIFELEFLIGKFFTFLSAHNLVDNRIANDAKYQPSGAGGTRSPPATPHRLQHLTARLIQNGRQGLEKD